MSRILFAWEMGGNLGHIARDLPLAIACREAGHEVLFAAKDLAVCVDAAREFDIHFVQAPVMRLAPTTASASAAINYADMLWKTGFSDTGALNAVLLGWQGLFRAFKPDVVVYDFAPRALLAARLAGIPVLLLGNGFETPPRISPLPSFRPWQPVSESEMLAAEARVVGRINSLLTADNKPRIDALWQLYAESPLLIAYAPEFDHFGPRPDAVYVGVTTRLPKRVVDVAWKTNGQRILVYLRAELDGVENLLASIHELGADSICFVPDISSEWQTRFASLRFFDSPVNIDKLLPHADLVITHGSSTVAQAVSAGVPVLVVPDVVEQYLAGLNAEVRNFGLVLRRNRSANTCARMISALLHKPIFRESTRLFALNSVKHESGRSINLQIQELTRLIETGRPELTAARAKET